MPENITHGSEENQVTTEVLVEILSNERRRFALYCLERYRTPMALADLADEVARLEYDAETLLEVSAEDVTEIYFDLYHTHLPKMADAGLLEYSQDQDAVSLEYDLSDLRLSKLI